MLDIPINDSDSYFSEIDYRLFDIHLLKIVYNTHESLSKSEIRIELQDVIEVVH